MPIVSTCPVCGGSDCPTMIDGIDEELRVSDIGSSRAKLSHGCIRRCRSCGFAFRQFRPTEKELALLYREADIQIYEREKANRARTAIRHRDLVQRQHPAPGRLLDVGCASGQFLKAMIDAGWEGWGVEPSTAEFRIAEETLGGRAILQNTILQDARFDELFNVVTFWDVLEHMTEPGA